MGDNGFSNFKKADPSPFALFCADTFLPTFGNSNAPTQQGSEHTSQPVTELAASGASECKPGKHQWLRPDNGYIECATCGKTRISVGDLAQDADAYFAHFGGAGEP